MLLIQASEAISDPSQANKMETLAKIVNGSKLMLKLIWWRAYTRTLRFCLSGQLDQWYKWSNWSENLKSPLISYLSKPGSWPIEFRVITGLFQSLWSIGSLVFHSFLVSIRFAYTCRNSMWMEFSSKDKWETYIYVIERTSGSCKWLL